MGNRMVGTALGNRWRHRNYRGYWQGLQLGKRALALIDYSLVAAVGIGLAILITQVPIDEKLVGLGLLDQQVVNAADCQEGSDNGRRRQSAGDIGPGHGQPAQHGYGLGGSNTAQELPGLWRIHRHDATICRPICHPLPTMPAAA